ncbi:TusE/DsrC/DsvC family sulfur relay protein [Pelotomaculum isophthalicicum JI]|uniref:TusE/DsrC/DsvC family sulfur relay protein n=1 Tax=Pelotomaculum isophthalicicum JI TaxID=947010 RepID=A0A9X4GYD3_9FIRM|nr:TusE/DsrC/DsvC family sulfur relay protein [Pelotomaculum isophthalicicum]MDF9407700.1 TusE/DsrC/DsvC family sulfur relay protein [Pelotomaculum isophthalicicum JI]
MSVLELNGVMVEIDEDGFLLDPASWSEDIARSLAASEGIDELNEEHWRVIAFLRNYYELNEVAPNLSTLCKEAGCTLKRIYQLFPAGPAKGACKLAGLPKPRGCI